MSSPDRPAPNLPPDGSSSAESNATEVAVGESLPTRLKGGLEIKTTRSKEHLFTTVYADADTGEVRLALQVDIRTGQTAIDPRRLDRSFWTLVVGEDRYPASKLERVLGHVPSPGIEVHPEPRELRIYSDRDAPNAQ